MNKKWVLIIISIALSFSFIQKEYSLINKRYYKNMRVYDLKTKGKEYLPALLNDKLSLVIFHSTHCPFNSTYDSMLDSIQQVHAKDSLQFIYVNSNSSENQIKQTDSLTVAFSKTHTGSYILDQNRSLEKLFNRISNQRIKNSTVILCRQSKDNIKTFYAGPIDESPQQKTGQKEYLETAIQNALKNKTTESTAINTGCRIVSH